MAFISSTKVYQFPSYTSSITGNWYIKKAKLKKKYPILTDKDLPYEERENGEILDKLKIKLALSKEEIQKIISAV
jgi:hypothetical protein